MSARLAFAISVNFDIFMCLIMHCGVNCDTHARLCDVSSWLLQRRVRRGSNEPQRVMCWTRKPCSVVRGTRKFGRGLTQLTHAKFHWFDVKYYYSVITHWCLYCTSLLLSVWRHTVSLRLYFKTSPSFHCQSTGLLSYIPASYTYGSRTFSVAIQSNDIELSAKTFYVCFTAVYLSHYFPQSTKIFDHSALEVSAMTRYGYNIEFCISLHVLRNVS